MEGEWPSSLPLWPLVEIQKMHFSKGFFGAVTYLARFVTPLQGEDDEISVLTPKWWRRAVNKNEQFSGSSPKPPPLSPLYIVEGDVRTAPTRMNEPKNSRSTTDGQ